MLTRRHTFTLRAQILLTLCLSVHLSGIAQAPQQAPRPPALGKALAPAAAAVKSAAGPLSDVSSAPKEFCGVWVRPEASPTSVTIQLDNMKRAGFNAVYVETFYHGFTIYPSKVVPIRPEMAGTDYLKLYIEEGKKRGIAVHAWIQVFYWEVDTKKYPQYPRTPLFDGHPDWILRLRDGSDTSKAETAHIFANPAHPGVRSLMAKYLEELLTNYAVDGLNLDYIRYPDGKEDAGYDEFTRQAYMKEAGVDPINIPKSPSSAEWKKWVEFREAQVLKMVEEIKAVKDRVRPQAALSTAIFPGAAEDRYTNPKMQNWRKMVELGLIDVLIPMAYDGSLYGIEQELIRSVEAVAKQPKVRLLPVLAIQRNTLDAYSGSTHPPVFKQAEIVQKLGLKGFSVFCYEWIIDSREGFDLFRQTID